MMNTCFLDIRHVSSNRKKTTSSFPSLLLPLSGVLKLLSPGSHHRRETGEQLFSILPRKKPLKSHVAERTIGNDMNFKTRVGSQGRTFLKKTIRNVCYLQILRTLYHTINFCIFLTIN